MNRLCNVTNGVDEEAMGSLNHKRLRIPKAIHVLSVGPMDCGSMVHDALLDGPNWRLTIATDSHELCVIPEEESIQVAILDNTLSEFELEDACLLIRQRWPLAKILLIGTGDGSHDYALYDDCVAPTAAPEFLLATIERLAAGWYQWRSRNVAL
jgi:hypothetical protein